MKTHQIYPSQISRPRRLKTRLVGALLASLALASPRLAAATTSSATFTTATNWSSLAWSPGVPGSTAGDIAQLSGGGSVNVTLTAPQTLGRLRLITTAGFNISFLGSSITFDNTFDATNNPSGTGLASLLMTRNAADFAKILRSGFASH